MRETLRALPHHFEPILINGIWTVPTPEIDIKVAFDEKFKDSNGFKDLGKFKDTPVLISGAGREEIGSINEPLPSKSADSKAGYLLWKEVIVGEEKILIAVQSLHEFTMTSHHTHDSSSEIFRKLQGKLYNYHNEEVSRVENQLRIQPGDSHLSFTTDQPALTLLIQRGQDIKHEYIKQPDYALLKEQADLLDNRLAY